MKILLVEDNQLLAVPLSAFLRKQHYTVDIASDGQEALALLEVFPYELLLLDIMLPKLDGISLCRQLRHRGYQLPILLLTARDTSTDKIDGLDAGADDYLVKPFEWQELLARIRALVRRGSFPVYASLEWGDLCLEPSICQVTYDEQGMELTPIEYSLLELFLRQRQRVFSCSALIDQLWSSEDSPTEGTVRSHVKGLRQKLKAAGAPADLIETVYSLGYRLRVLPPEQHNRDQPSQFLREESQEKTLSALAQTWERLKPDVLSQVALLEQVATIQQMGSCSNELQQQAITEAHKLAGLLGTFGFPLRSELSHEIEDLLRTGVISGAVQASRLWELAAALRQVLAQPKAEGRKAQAALPILQDKLPRLLIVDDDTELTELLKQEAASWGIQVEVAISPAAAKSRILDEPPDVVLLDVWFSDSPEDGLTLLRLTNLVSIPVVVFTVRGAFADRLKVSRLKAHSFLHKPMAPKQVLAAVSQVLQQTHTYEFQVLIVDDDPRMLVRLETLLQPLGLKLTTLTDSRLLWNTLERVAPDLLILDLKMPHVDGIELCHVVRSDPRWNGLPIMVVTSYTDTGIVQQVFAAGADDFVAKPIVEPELVTRVMTRLKRTQLLRQSTEIYPSTR